MDALAPWALVLAAGEGSRLRALTTDPQGNTVPKQFCSLNGGGTLLQLAIQRALQIAPWERVTTVVAAQHEKWWRGELALMPSDNVIVQPRNRGTAIGVLMPLLRILARDPWARIVLLPSDHFVADEAVLAGALREALVESERHPERIVLLGIVPDEPDSEFGWIVPSDHDKPGVQRVQKFVEKPALDVARDLMLSNGVWNSFILVADGRTLFELFRKKLSRELTALSEQIPDDLACVYDELSTIDFCRDVLEGHEDSLSVLPVPYCGWSDLGTPARVARCIERFTPSPGPPPPTRTVRVALNLAEVCSAGVGVDSVRACR